MKLKTEYFINRDKHVRAVEFTSDGQSCAAVLASEDGSAVNQNVDPSLYIFRSYLHGDQNAVESGRLMSLADCILAAHVLLGVIPPHKFDPIDCPNKH